MYELINGELVEVSDDRKAQILASQENAQKANNYYATKRAAEYPPITEQLDTIFHGGLDAWKAQIQAVKNKYPKETK